MGTQPEVANFVRRQRRLADMTQQELAERAGVTRQTILSIEKGNYTPSVALALKLAQVLKVSVDCLFQLTKGENDE